MNDKCERAIFLDNGKIQCGVTSFTCLFNGKHHDIYQPIIGKCATQGCEIIAAKNEGYKEGYDDCFRSKNKGDCCDCNADLPKDKDMDYTEWPSDEDLKQISKRYDVKAIGDKLAGDELIRISELNLDTTHKAVWLSNVLTNFFIKGYNLSEKNHRNDL